jgi:CheY-like chemotaxis protein
MLESGEIAMISELILSPERVGRFLWPGVFYQTDHYTLLSRADYPDVDVTDILHSRIGLTKNTAYTELFRQWFPGHTNTAEYPDMLEILDALEQGEVALVMGTQNQLLSATNYLEKPGFKANIMFSQTYGSTFGFNLNETLLCSIVEKALGQVDTKTIAGRWSHRVFDYRGKLARSQMPYLIGASVLLLCLITLLFFMFLRSRRVSRALEAAVLERTRELAAQTEIALSASRAKSDFLAEMSHEIRTPLNAILGMTELMLRKDLDLDVYDNALGIKRAGSSLLSLINDILDFSKIEPEKKDGVEYQPASPAGNGGEIPVLRFTAPDARVLIVDDIEINLDVAEGIIDPYRMSIDRAGGGLEALRMVQENQYDLVFMDQMMPGMDGFEAAAAIRAWEESQGKKRVPIVALTANAVSGTKDLFLEKGFDDYISKPIEIEKLDRIMARWIPAEKKVKAALKRESFNGDGGLIIPGVDVNRGINMTGGTEPGYRKVLVQFYKDAAERLPIFAPTETKGGDNDRFPGGKPDRKADPQLSAFTTQAHAIKSAAGTIGAEGVSKEAAALEAAGKAGDIRMIHRILPGFYEHLVQLLEGIGKVLEEDRSRELPGTARNSPEGTEKSPETSAPSCFSALSALRAALDAKSMKEVDRLFEEIDRLPLDAITRDAVNDISDRVLMGEYEEALEGITILLAGKI